MHNSNWLPTLIGVFSVVIGSPRPLRGTHHKSYMRYVILMCFQLHVRFGLLNQFNNRLVIKFLLWITKIVILGSRIRIAMQKLWSSKECFTFSSNDHTRPPNCIVFEVMFWIHFLDVIYSHCNTCLFGIHSYL